MNRRWKLALAALASVITLSVPALGANVVADGQTLGNDQAWVKNGTSYITLRALSQTSSYDLGWNGKQAQLNGPSLELAARPGELYITVNDRALYVEDGVQVVDGTLALPLRVVASATGADLRWDSKTNTALLDTQQAVPGKATYNQEDLYWLSRIISAESGGEPLLGQIAVGNVVLNRVKSSQYPNTIKDVVFDARYAIQFEPVANGTIYHQPTQSAVLAAKMCLEGADVVGDCLYFYAPALSAGSWIVNNRTYYTTIGCHRFYR